MPDTGDWQRFESVATPLPPLAAGPHTFVLESSVANSTRNIDAFVFIHGGLDAMPPALRASIVARSNNGRWELQATPEATIGVEPGALFTELDRHWQLYEAFMGWAPAKPVRVHLVGASLWDNPGATAYQNQWGLFFRAESMATDQGNIAHEMTHQFYLAHFPGWFDESSVRALTSMVWMPRLHNTGIDEAEGWLSDGRALAANPTLPITTPERLWATLAAEFGPDVFSRFFHACSEAGASGEIDFAPGRHLTRDEILRLMGRAAGRDVGPVFRRWPGFAEQP